MEHNNDSSPRTSGPHTPPVPAGGGWGPMGQGLYNTYPWAGMMPGMAAGGASAPGWPGMMPGGQGVPGMMPGWGVGAPGMMPGWQPGMHPGMQGTPVGDNVYRPTFDFATAASHTSTPVEETQFDVNETFSLEELGLGYGGADTPVQVGRGRGAARKKKGKRVVGESSQPVDDDGLARRRWTDEENVALSKAWISVCDDPLCSNNQRIVNLWAKIATAYHAFCPGGRTRTGEECRKGWDRIRTAVSRFSGLYTNALRMQSSGQTEDDCRRIAEKAFPQPGLYKEFTYWNCYRVLMDSEKFRAGIEAGWPKKQRLNYTGAYSGSSAGSHDLPENVEEVPSPTAFARRTRPIGQRRAQRAARGVSQSPSEVQSAAVHPGRSSAELAYFAREQTRQSMVATLAQWKAATNPQEKRYLGILLDSQAADLAAHLKDGGEGGDDGGEGGDGGEGDGDEGEGGEE